MSGGKDLQTLRKMYTDTWFKAEAKAAIDVASMRKPIDFDTFVAARRELIISILEQMNVTSKDMGLNF